MWAVGGGKGGVGKSVISALLAFWLARMGKRTVLVDADLGGANLHTLLGIKNPQHNLADFVAKRHASLEEICIHSDMENLRLICGASEVLSLANLQFAQKVKVIQNLFKLDSDYVILDLGAGSSFHFLDFFIVSHRKILVLTPQPTSIQNAYGFIRNAVFRRLVQLSRQNPSLQALVKTAMNPKNELQMRTLKDLLQAVEESDGTETRETVKKEVHKIKPAIITNMVRSHKDKNAGRIVQIVAEKYMMINSVDLGSIPYDRELERAVSNMTPFVNLDKSSEAVAHTYDIVTNLAGNNAKLTGSPRVVPQKLF